MPFLDALTPQDRESLRRAAATRAYPRGTALFHERQMPERVHLLQSGEVKLTCTLESGREIMLGIRGPGELLGELSALDGFPRSAGAIALGDVEAWTLGLGEWRRFLDGSPSAVHALLRTLSERLRESDRATIQFAEHDAVGRLAIRLLDLADRYGHVAEAGVQIDLPLSQEEIASWIGASRESVAKALQTLRELGWVETGRRTIVLRDRPAIERRIAGS